MGNAITSMQEVIQWLTRAFKKLTALISVGDATNAAALASEIQGIVTMYLNIIKEFLPTQTVSAFPKNTLSRLTWFAKNISWIQILVTFISGTNPFTYAKSAADQVANKWGF
jgi:hypothetical protein